MRSDEDRIQFVRDRAMAMDGLPTPAEAELKVLLKPLGFKFQWPIHGETKNGGKWNYILDAYHEVLKLCVEVDGPIHRKRKGRDRRRDARLAGEGIRTIRFKNQEVIGASGAVKFKIKFEMDCLREMRDGNGGVTHA